MTIPVGFQHLQEDKIESEKKPRSSNLNGFLEESLFWSEQQNLKITPSVQNGNDSKFIILADDNKDMRNYIHRLLLESGHNWQIQAVSNGIEALQAAKERAPDLILTDVMMPGMDGLGLLKTIRSDEVLKVTPIVFLSARADEKTKVEGIEHGADDYLIKPFSTKELIARVSTNLEMSAIRKKAAQQSQANLAKSQFLANMSHEIRTPLGAILGFAELILIDQGMTERSQRDCIQAIIKNGQQLTHVINEILDLSKIESEKLDIENVRFTLLELMEDVTAILNLKAQEKGLTLKIIYKGRIPNYIVSDPMRIRQILMNLVGNAIKFTHHGDVEICIEYLFEKKQLEFTVADTGIGMTKEQQAVLFQRFMQADNSMTRKYGGVGLGLVISQNMARALGGDLSLKKSEFNYGSTFVFTISDQTATKIPQQNLVSSSQEPSLFKNKDEKHLLDHVKVLLVDDYSENRVLISYLLKLAGADVTCAENGDEGVKAALSTEYDVVLMDLQMPVKDGFEATTELRSHSFKKPIIALTAHTMKGDRERCLQRALMSMSESQWIGNY